MKSIVGGEMPLHSLFSFPARQNFRRGHSPLASHPDAELNPRRQEIMAKLWGTCTAKPSSSVFGDLNDDVAECAEQKVNFGSYFPEPLYMNLTKCYRFLPKSNHCLFVPEPKPNASNLLWNQSPINPHFTNVLCTKSLMGEGHLVDMAPRPHDQKELCEELRIRMCCITIWTTDEVKLFNPKQQT